MNRPSTTAMEDKNFLLVGIFFKNRNLLKSKQKTIIIIIQCIFYPIFIGWESIKGSANNCLQIMVCSCIIPSQKSIFATNNILLMRNRNQALVVVALVRRKPIDFYQQRALTASTEKTENKLGDRMIKQLLNSVIADIAKYHDCQCLADQSFDWPATDKSRYFDQPRLIIVLYTQQYLYFFGMLRQHFQGSFIRPIGKYFGEACWQLRQKNTHGETINCLIYCQCRPKRYDQVFIIPKFSQLSLDVVIPSQ